MSLITLRSSTNDNGANIFESASNFSNHFKEGIVISPGDTLELVSMSINKIEKFEVVQGLNDTLIWRIGTGPSSSTATSNFAQHVVTLTAGSYNGADLAKHIQDQLNNSTLLGVYEGKWVVTFTASAGQPNPTNASFKIDYGENSTPSNNAKELTLTQHWGSGTPYSTAVAADDLEISMTADVNLVGNRFVSTNGIQANSSGTTNPTGYSFVSDRSVWANGGVASINVAPVKGFRAAAGINDCKFHNWNNDGNDVAAAWTAMGSGDSNLQNGWTHRVAIDSGAAGAIKTVTTGDHGQVASVNTFTGGTGYTVGDTGNLTGGTGTSGASYEIVTAAGGVPSAITIVTGGIGFKVDDVLTLAGSGDGLATCKVATISVADGTGYSVANDVLAGGGNGTGAKINIVSIDAATGAITQISIADEGSGYSVGDTLIINGGNNDATFKVASVGGVTEEFFGAFDYTGRMGLTQDTSGTSFNDNSFTGWAYNFLMTNPNGGAKSRWQSDTSTGGAYFIQMVKDDGSGGDTGFDITYFNYYPSAIIGMVRTQLVDGFTVYPGNNNAVFLNSDDGMDIQVQIDSDDISPTSNPQFQVFQMLKRAGTSYPNANWRESKEITDLINPTAFATGNPSAPVSWTSFQNGTDHIRISIELNNVRNFVFKCSHDTAGNAVFLEQTTFLKSGQNQTGGDVLRDLISNTREIFYPFRAAAFVSRGLPFQPAKYRFGGVYDTKVITQAGKDLQFVNGGSISNDAHGAEEDSFDPVQPTSLTADPLTLPVIYKFGPITGNDIHNGSYATAGPNQISSNDLTPNTANTNILLGLEPGYTFQTGQATNPVETDASSVPFSQVSNPTLHVELPDFNIKSFSGESSDTGRAIAVIPKEQWTTDQQSGTLHYIAPYPIPIDINVASMKPFYELNARLRQPDGKLADDLINPTQLTLRKRVSDEKKQEMALSNALSAMRSMEANLQDQKISNFGSNNPLL